MNNNWRRYNIFLSSTFKDMDYERDVIKFKVIPELNRRLRDRRVELQAIDLRLGVNTAKMSEEESELKVLDVCTSCINSSRPFFIGLIGQRYGWIPPVERWKEFIAGLSEEDRELLKDTEGCSVTEMEIVYGALSQGSFDSSHVLFFLRDEASYEGIPEELKSSFCESDPEVLAKLKALKHKVQQLFRERAGEDDRCTAYHLDWKDGEFCSEQFEAIVTEQLAQQIELETAREEQDGSSNWWKQEGELELSTLLRLLPGSIDLPASDMDTEEGSDYAISYVHGFGASTALARRYSEWDGEEDVIRLVGVFGLSEYSDSMRPILVRWIHELAQLLQEKDNLPEDEPMLTTMPDSELYDIFEALVSKAAEDYYIYIYLDNVEQLETRAPKDLHMNWLARVKDKVNISINLPSDSVAEKTFLKDFPHVRRQFITGVEGDAALAEELISNYEKEYFLELPESIRTDMLKAAKGRKTILPPLKVHNLIRLFESLTREDFKQIRDRKGSQIEAINGYLEELWEEMPDTPYDIMTFMVNSIAHNLGLGEQMRQAIWTIAAAPGGLREQDIARFAGEQWDALQFWRAMNFLQDFFFEDGARHLWRAKYLTVEEDVLQKRQKEISEYILTLDSGDSFRETMGLYYAVAGGELSHYAHYLLEGDFLHGGNMTHLKDIYGPQFRQLQSDGVLDSNAFEKYCRGLEPGPRLQLMMAASIGLSYRTEDVQRLVGRMSEWLEDVEPAQLGIPECFVYASLAGHNVKYLDKAIWAAGRCSQAGFPDSDRLQRELASTGAFLLQQNGQKARAEELLRQTFKDSPADRMKVLNASLTSIGPTDLIFKKKKAAAKLEQYFREYDEITGSLEMNQEGFSLLVSSAHYYLSALEMLLPLKNQELLFEKCREYFRTVKMFVQAEGFDGSVKALEIVFHYLVLAIASAFASEQYELCSALAAALLRSERMLREADPENCLLQKTRSRFAQVFEFAEKAAEDYEDKDLKQILDLIEERYAETQN
ncbi:MAG: DUF4062 domain-containing protein [Candidatus Cryptobacteroides sp.]